MVIPGWLPPLITSATCGGWGPLLDAAHQQYLNDFTYSITRFQGRKVKVRRLPVTDAKEAAFWHLIQEGEVEDERTPSIARCERIAWIRAMIESVDDPARELRVWGNMRQSKSGPSLHWNIALSDFSYLVALRDDGETVLLLTAFPVEREKRQKKLERGYQAWCDEQAKKA